MPQDPQNALVPLSTQQALTKVGRQLAIKDKLLAFPPAEPDLIPFLLIKKDGTRKWGFANRKKEIVIPCVYDWVYPFCEGMAKVIKNRKNGFITSQGVELPIIYTIVYE
jgi:WG containing repeat